MLIYISVNIRGSVFSGSEAQTVLQLAYALSSPQGGNHDVKLLNVSPTKQQWYDDCKSLQKKWEQVAADNIVKAELLIDVTGLTAEDRMKYTKQSVLFIRNNYLYQLESSIYPANQCIQDISGLSEIWTWETDDETIMVLKCIGNCPVITITYLWNPFIVQAYFVETHGIHKFPTSIPSTWNIRIAENNTSNTSNCTFPLIALKHILDSSAINCDSIIVYNSEHLRDNKFFQDNILKNSAGSADKAPIRLLEGRMRVLDTILIPRTIFFSHIRFRTMRWMLFECAWTGIPVVHNSIYLKSIGGGLERCYYSDNSITKACDAFKGVIEDSTTLSGIFSEDALKEIRKTMMSNYFNSLVTLSVAVKNVSSPITVAVAPQTTVLPTTVKVYTIAFHDMWADFQPSYNFFTLLLESTAHPNTKIIGKWAHDCTESPNLVIMGPYGNGVPPFKEVPTVFHTSECVEAYPQHEDIKLKLGFISSSPDEIRLPHWMISINWFGADVDKLVNPRTIPPEWTREDQSTPNRKKFASFIVSNPSNPIRNKAFIDLCKYKQVDSAGRVMNTIGNELFAGLGGGGGELRKVEFMRKYRYAIVYENQTAPGYVTEKLLHAKAAGCIPIYWGDKAALTDFEPTSFVYMSDEDNIVDIVKFLESQPRIYKKIAETPALTADGFEAAKKAVADTANSMWKILTGAVTPGAVTPGAVTPGAVTPGAVTQTLTENTPISFVTFDLALSLLALSLLALSLLALSLLALSLLALSLLALSQLSLKH